MKKISLIIISSLFLLPIVAQEQQNKQESEKTEFSKWSVSIDAGLNAFDGDMKATPYNWHQNVRGGLSLGAIVDYTFNPTVSLGLMYNYLPLSANNHSERRGNGGSLLDTGGFTSTYHLVAPVLSINVINAISKTVDTKWGLWFSAGIGLGFFSSDLDVYAIDQPTLSDNTIKSSTTVDGIAVAIPLGANLEYNLTKNLALGLKIQYLANSRDDLEGEPSAGRYTKAGVTNDFISSAAVNLRWKFGANKTPHTRDVNRATYSPDKTDILARALKGDVDNLKKRVDAIDDLGKRVDDLESRVGDIEALLSSDGPDDDGDGVPNHRDREPNTPRGTPVNFWGIPMSPKDYSSVPFIFFAHDKTTLDDNAYETIYMVAELLKANPALLVEVRGFADYTGKDAYNLKLSERRAERVKKELVDVYGVDAKRIGTNGKGRIIEPRAKYRANRRVEFHFSE